MKAKAKEFKFKIIPIEHGYDVVWTMAKDFKAGDYHVIEAAPVLAEIAQLKKQLAETKKQLDDLIAAELGG